MVSKSVDSAVGGVHGENFASPSPSDVSGRRKPLTTAHLGRDEIRGREITSIIVVPGCVLIDAFEAVGIDRRKRSNQRANDIRGTGTASGVTDWIGPDVAGRAPAIVEVSPRISIGPPTKSNTCGPPCVMPPARCIGIGWILQIAANIAPEARRGAKVPEYIRAPKGLLTELHPTAAEGEKHFVLEDPQRAGGRGGRSTG